jgi:hypothetical protein
MKIPVVQILNLPEVKILDFQEVIQFLRVKTRTN